MTGIAPSVTSVISCPPTISGWPFSSSRAPAVSVSEPVVVNGAVSVIRPRISRLANTPLAVPPSPVRTVRPSPMIVCPASALLVTVSVKPLVSSVAPGSRNRSRSVTLAVSRGITVVAADTYTREAAAGTPRGLQFAGLYQLVSAPFHNASKLTGAAGSTCTDSVCSSDLPAASVQRTVNT